MPKAKLESKPRARAAVDADLTRDKLLDAAGPVFAEKGYYAATVREICARARANVAAVNYHFGDKLGLYTEVLRRCKQIAHMKEMNTALAQDAPPEEIFRLLIRTRMRCVRQGTVADMTFRIMVHELAQPTPAMTRMIT